VAPAGTPGEYVAVNPLPATANGVAGPLGLGFRVPMLVVSPFSRGGYVSSEGLDHTSQIRILEERFGIHSTGISAWRRQAVGNLTSTLRMGAPETEPPVLPPTSQYTVAAMSALGCTTADFAEARDDQPPNPLGAVQAMPTQEGGTVKRT
jgi:phospholipase C